LTVAPADAVVSFTVPPAPALGVDAWFEAALATEPLVCCTVGVEAWLEAALATDPLVCCTVGVEAWFEAALSGQKAPN